MQGTMQDKAIDRITVAEGNTFPDMIRMSYEIVKRYGSLVVTYCQAS